MPAGGANVEQLNQQTHTYCARLVRDRLCGPAWSPETLRHMAGDRNRVAARPRERLSVTITVRAPEKHCARCAAPQPDRQPWHINAHLSAVWKHYAADKFNRTGACGRGPDRRITKKYALFMRSECLGAATKKNRVHTVSTPPAGAPRV